MINIIPKPYRLIDYNKKIPIDGFSYECDSGLESGLSVLKEEYKNSGVLISVTKKNFHNDDAYTLEVLEDRVLIEAKNVRGVFYATRSLVQLIDARFLETKIDLLNTKKIKKTRL